MKYIFHGLGIAPPGKALRRGVDGDPLFQQYRLHTGADQRASLRLNDGTTLHINENTSAVLASPNVTRVESGEVAEYLKPGTDHRIQTASAVAAAIGTKFDVQVQGGRTRFVVLEGALSVRGAGKPVVVKSNQQTYVAPGASPLPPSPVDAKAVFAWNSGIPAPDLGEDIALDANNGQIVGYSSALVSNGGNGDVHHVNDGILTEGWISALGKSSNQWVKIGFEGNSYRVSDVIIDPAATGGAPSTEDLKQFEIRVSTTGKDDASFTTVLRGTCTAQNALQRFSLPVPVRARYVELVAVNNNGSASGVAVAELEVVATSSLIGLPSDVAVDGAGNMYVADTNNNRIVKFSPHGKTLATWGKKGAGHGEFLRPQALTLDRHGNIYVADTENHRVQELSPSGRYVASWGSPGVGKGQLLYPDGVAVDSRGHILVTDISGRIQTFAHTGAVLAVWDSFGSAGSLSYPGRVAVGPSGAIAVADTGNDRVLELTPSGQLERVVGSAGSGQGQLDSPVGVAFAPDGSVVVADSGNDRIEVFGSGSRSTAIGSAGFGPGKFMYPTGVAVNAAGQIYVADYGNSRIQKFSGSGKHLSTWGRYATVANVLGQPFGIAIDAHGYAYVADDTNNRVQVRSPRGNVAAVFGHFGFTLHERTPGLGQFWYPHGVAIAKNGAIYVADSFNDRIQVLSNAGPVRTIGGAPGTADALSVPLGVAVDARRRVYVADTYHNRVAVFASSGRFLRAFGSEGTGPGQFELPTGIAVDAEGHVYVSDFQGQRIQKFRSDGTPLAVWGNASSGIGGRFFGPRGLAVDREGNVYVADLGHDVIQKLSPDGKELQVFELPGPDPTPAAVAVDAAGNVYATDEFNARIIKFSPTGTITAVWR